jgi:hypothetical protein
VRRACHDLAAQIDARFLVLEPLNVTHALRRRIAPATSRIMYGVPFSTAVCCETVTAAVCVSVSHWSKS